MSEQAEIQSISESEIPIQQVSNVVMESLDVSNENIVVEVQVNPVPVMNNAENLENGNSQPNQ